MTTRCASLASASPRAWASQPCRLAKTFAALLLALLAAALLLALRPAPALAATTVRVGYYEQEVFEEGAEEGAIKRGYAYEYYRKISEYTGWEYEYVYGDYATLYQDLLEGRVDLLAGLAKTEGRVGSIGYPDAPMGTESYVLLRHTADVGVGVDAASLADKRIGVLESALVPALESYLDEHHVNAEIATYRSYEQLFNAFDLGTIDLLAAEGDGMRAHPDAVPTLVFGNSDYYLCVTAGRDDLLAELNEAQRRLAADDPEFFSSLRTKYYPATVSSKAFSPEELAWLNSHHELKVGYLRHYLPYSDSDAAGKPLGLVQDIVPTLLDSLGVHDLQVSYTGFESYDDMVASVRDGSIDVAFPVGGGLYFSEADGINQSAPVVQTIAELVYQGEYSDDKLSLMAVNANNTMHRYYMQNYYPDVQTVEYPSIEACLDAVASGEVQSTTVGGLRAHALLKDRRYRGLSTLRLSHDDDRCFGTRIGEDGLLRLLNRGVNVLSSDYGLDRAALYVDELYSYGATDFLLDHLAVLAALAAAAVAAIVATLAHASRKDRRQRDQLAAALAAVEGANQAKRAFMNGISHDLQGPMADIVGLTELAQQHAGDPRLVSDDLDRISVASQHLLSLINDVLDLSKLEEGRLRLELKETSLTELIDDIYAIVQPEAHSRQQTLTIETDDIEHELIVCDRLRLSQVLLNTLGNASRYTGEGCALGLRVTERGLDGNGAADYEFRIWDTGGPMGPAYLGSLFGSADAPPPSSLKGAEAALLSMSLTKALVDLMGGTIVAKSSNSGSAFVIALKLQVADSPQD